MRFIGLLMVAGVIGFSHSAEAQGWEVHEGHAVKGNGTNAPKLVFSDTDAQDLEEFVDLCREVCTSGNGDGRRGACGGFVVNYTDRAKTAPRVCIFKLAGSVPYAKEWKDTHMLVNEDGGTAENEQEDRLERVRDNYETCSRAFNRKYMQKCPRSTIENIESVPAIKEQIYECSDGIILYDHYGREKFDPVKDENFTDVVQCLDYFSHWCRGDDNVVPRRLTRGYSFEKFESYGCPREYTIDGEVCNLGCEIDNKHYSIGNH